MAVDASLLPALFIASTHPGGSPDPGYFTSGGQTRYLASVDGYWTQTPEPDQFHVDAATFAAVASATVDGPLLIVGGANKAVTGHRDGNGVKWIELSDPE